MAMLDNIFLPADGTLVDLYAVTGVARGNELRWQNLSNTMVYGYVDDAILADGDKDTKHRKHPPLVPTKASGSQYIMLWAPQGAEIHVESA